MELCETKEKEMLVSYLHIFQTFRILSHFLQNDIAFQAFPRVNYIPHMTAQLVRMDIVKKCASL